MDLHPHMPMDSNFYLPRKLSGNDKTYSEMELLSSANYVVILAEPGGGKTELMGSLARQLGTVAITANKFRHMNVKTSDIPLVIDAFDELAKVDESGIYSLLGQVVATRPTYVYLSSRSSEWDNAATNTFKEFIGHSPFVVRLCEFDETEQRVIFEHYLQEVDFDAFQREVKRFDLESLLPNPQFLKLFADAYIESNRHFSDKRSIFSQAVERLAKEANSNIKRVNAVLSSTQKIDISSEVFAKLLLSGADGVSTSEATEDRIYPLLESLFSVNVEADGILATRLFKPGDSADQHRHVHKIVAEYCAADYLTRRITDPADHLTIYNCMPIIAPNSIVRDELRGLLGWMASLGNKPIQEAAIELDPYAVLANGDPSLLEGSSKHLLVNRLKQIEDKDPYFRRGDFWRRFSVAGFFSPDVISEIKPLLVTRAGGDLRDLVLELLEGSPAIEQLTYELRQLLHTPVEGEHTRLLANRCLLSIKSFNNRANLGTLIFEASLTSLKIAADIIERLGPEVFDKEFLSGYLRVCANLYPKHHERFEGTIGGRYFMKRFISRLDLKTIISLMDRLAKDLSCTCGKDPFRCDCRNGMSKILGLMLDRYFELATSPFDPNSIWRWVNNLNFHQSIKADQSIAVRTIQGDDSLRQRIMTLALGRLTDRDKILEMKTRVFNNWHSHSGLSFRPNDFIFLVKMAFDANNHSLWASFYIHHQKKDHSESNCLRQLMRKHAYEKTSFMSEWAKAKRNEKTFLREHGKYEVKHTRIMKRHNRKKDEIRKANIKFVQDNKQEVENGRNWNCLVRFAELVLHESNNIEKEFGDAKLVRNALKNCLPFISEYIPDLKKLAEFQCASKGLQSENILYAACLEILSTEGNLESVDFHLLKALRTNIHMSYQSVSEQERDLLKAEVDRLIVPDMRSAEEFLRQYVEPQLAQSECNNSEVWLLGNEEVFSQCRASLSIEWLQRFRWLDIVTLNSLFEISAQYSNRDDLKLLIAERCAEFIHDWHCPLHNKNIEPIRTFWILRGWYFLNDTSEIYWDWLKGDRDTVLLLDKHSGRINRSDHPYWPTLSSIQVEAILNSFIDKWPKVDLPSHYGTSSPKGENAYRFLTNIIWLIDLDKSDDAITVLDRLISKSIFADLHKSLKSIRENQIRKRALIDFEPPKPKEIVKLLDNDIVVTVEGLRQLVIQELKYFQKVIDGGEFDSVKRFYDKDKRLGEVDSTLIVAERLNLRLEPKDISITPEHQLKNANRSDFTVTKMINGKKRLLVTEVKGQWHKELYTAASAQLYDRYSIHPDAEQQGIYLVIWFGSDELVADRRKHGLRSARELKLKIEEELPSEIKGLIDVFVLDVSKSK